MCAQSYTLALPRHRLSQGSDAQLTHQTFLPTTPQTPTPQNSSQGSVEPHTPESPPHRTPVRELEWNPDFLYNTTELRSWKVCPDPGAQFPCNITEQSVHQGWMLEPQLPHLQTQQGRAYVGGIGGKTISKRHTYFCESSPENKEKTAPFFSVPLHGTLFKGKSISVIPCKVFFYTAQPGAEKFA